MFVMFMGGVVAGVVSSMLAAMILAWRKRSSETVMDLLEDLSDEEAADRLCSGGTGPGTDHVFADAFVGELLRALWYKKTAKVFD